MAKWIVVRNTECEDNSLLPIRADVICVPLNCCILRSSNLQSHCVEHAPWLLRVHCWQALLISFMKTHIYMAFALGWLSFIHKVWKMTAFPCCAVSVLVSFPLDCPLLSFAWWDYSFRTKWITWFLLAFAGSCKTVHAFLALKCAIVIRNGGTKQSNESSAFNPWTFVAHSKVSFDCPIQPEGTHTDELFPLKGMLHYRIGVPFFLLMVLSGLSLGSLGIG